MKNNVGEILTNKEAILEEATQHYKKVFEEKPMEESIKSLKMAREKLCQQRLDIAKKDKSPQWTVEDIKFVLKHLKKKISKDPYELPNEIFHLSNAGDDLILALTKLMNKIKDLCEFPECLTVCNVTNAYKNKGDQSKFDSYRGLFRTPVIRNILDKLLYVDLYETIDNNLTDCNVGSRKRRNIRDNLFVINAISNESKQKDGEACDICIYDIRKCHDSLWLHECINDLWDLGIRNDKLALLYLENESAQIVVKTSSGTTEQITINNKIMQGTVWAGLMCTSTMDKLGKEVYDDPSLVYKYRGTVDVPPLEMVDDVITTSKCGTTTVTLNATVNSFVERKKLELSSEKCSRIHIGKKHDCPGVKVHNNEMKSTLKEKYLGDFVTNEANANETLIARKARAYAILTEIRALLSEIPLGTKRFEIGMALRGAWFINGVLYNSEVWGHYAHKHIDSLEVIDHMILKTILGAQAKVTVETLYQETGAMSVRNVISVRRMLYLKTILDREDHEITKKVYVAMKNNTFKGDWYNLITEDFAKIGLEIDEETIMATDKDTFKKLIKTSVWNVFFQELETKKLTHTKVRNIIYSGSRVPEKYLTSPRFDNNMRSLLFNLRCRSVNEFHDNFHTMYGKEPPCRVCLTNIDSQEHSLVCSGIKEELTDSELDMLNSLKYSDLFGNESQQFLATKMYQRILEIREFLLTKPTRHGLPGQKNSGPD